MPTTKLISSINDSVEKAMEKLTELRLTFQMKELNKQQQSSSASSALGTPLSDLTSSLSNLLTAAAVDLRSAVRLQKLEDEQREKHHRQQHNHNHVSGGNCSECAVNNNSSSSSSSSQAFCIHKSALADRVIDRTFDQHKAMLREELKEVKSELEKFKSGAAYQTLRQRIDELELKLREEKMKKKNAMDRSGANHEGDEKERKQQFSINRNERDQIVSVSSFEEEKKRRQAKVINDKNKEDAAGMFSLATVDDMIANFKNRCEDRAQKRREVEESVQLEREKEKSQLQEQNQQQRIAEEEKSSKATRQLDTLLLNSLIRNFNHLLAAHRQEEAKIEERKTDLLFLFMPKIMMAKTHHEPQLPPLSATPRVPSAPQQQQNDEGGEPLQNSHIITSGRRRTSSSSSSSRKKILDVTPKPLHEKMNSMMTTTSGRRW